MSPSCDLHNKQQLSTEAAICIHADRAENERDTFMYTIKLDNMARTLATMMMRTIVLFIKSTVIIYRKRYPYTSGARRRKHRKRIHAINIEVLATLDDKSYHLI